MGSETGGIAWLSAMFTMLAARPRATSPPPSGFITAGGDEDPEMVTLPPGTNMAPRAERMPDAILLITVVPLEHRTIVWRTI